MRIHGEDRLTASDQAVYEMLLALAREDGIDKDWHRVPVGDIRKFLGLEKHLDRVVESLDRIAGTLVSYDLRGDEFRRRGKFPLAIYEMSESLKSSTAVLEYMIPPPIRRLVKNSKSYARLEIGAFPRFKSKYTARLYPRLALRAGYDEPLRKPWTIDPQQLADEMGFPYTVWNYRHFKRDCLDKILKDISESVTRFSVAMEEVSGAGRGRPIRALVFRMSSLGKALEESRYIPLTKPQLERLAGEDGVHGRDEMPSVSVVGRAMTYAGESAEDLMDAWRAALDRAKSYHGGGPEAVGFDDTWLLYVLKTKGADEAFKQWLQRLPEGKPLDVTRTPVLPPPPPSFRRPVLAPPVVPEAKDVLDDLEGVDTFEPVVVNDPFDYLDSVPAPQPSAAPEDDVLDDLIPF
jgi:hypothetical protein